MMTLMHVEPELNMDSMKVFAQSTYHAHISNVVLIFRMSFKALGIVGNENIIGELNNYLERNDYLGLFKYAVEQFESCDPHDRNLKGLFRNLVIGIGSNIMLATDLFLLRESIGKIRNEFDKLATRETEKIQPVGEM